MRTMRMAIVDDDMSLCRSLQAYIMRKFSREIEIVGVATDGLSGFELLKAKKPDVAVLDVALPNRSGVSLLRDIRNNRELSSMVCIMVSTIGAAWLITDMNAYRFDYFYMKPFEIDDMVSKAVELYKRKNTVTPGDDSEQLVEQGTINEIGHDICAGMQQYSSAKPKNLTPIFFPNFTTKLILKNDLEIVQDAENNGFDDICNINSNMSSYSGVRPVMRLITMDAAGNIERDTERGTESGINANEITLLLGRLGINRVNRGYSYLQRGIQLCMRDRNYLESVTKLLYPEIARYFGTTMSRVERSIRTLLDRSWDDGAGYCYTSLLRLPTSFVNKRPTNKTFLFHVVQILEKGL